MINPSTCVDEKQLTVQDSSSSLPLGSVYLWHSNYVPTDGVSFRGFSAGRVELTAVQLPRLWEPARLSGCFATVCNSSVVKSPDQPTQQARPLGNATPDENGNFLFEPFRGGGRMEKHPFREPEMWERYISAARFGEVNVYFHLDRIANYIDSLLRELGFPSLPVVTARVNAHNAIAEIAGQCDGVRGQKSGVMLPMQGAHYRLPSRKRLTVVEHLPIEVTGEIHFGPGWKLCQHGALAERTSSAYRHNASHNAGTIYHEFGHHLTRYTADFRANQLRNPFDQCNYKTETDEAFCDYLTATMLNSPHIWAFQHRHDEQQVHPRSLTSTKTMDDFDSDRRLADAHENGTILAAALWDIREAALLSAKNQEEQSKAIRNIDLLVVNTLILIGQLRDHPTSPTEKGTRRLRRPFGVVRQALLESDRRLFGGLYEALIRTACKRRKIKSKWSKQLLQMWGTQADTKPLLSPSDDRLRKLRAKAAHAVVPKNEELLSAGELESKIRSNHLGPYSLVAVGDVMVGARARKRTNEFGYDYIFQSVAPLFRRSAIVLANQEGPIAKLAAKLPRNYSYRVNPRYTQVLRRAGINVVTLANNHLLDCGRKGVLETLTSLRKHNIWPLGAGENETDAHRPVILQAGCLKVGLLGYYWNRRTAATSTKPGSAMDSDEHLAHDIGRLKSVVDRIVVTVHWGVPYLREPNLDDQRKARHMIALGADAVIGHHPHIVQKIEIFKERPIIYSLGNFAFGTGNSRAESLVAAIDFRTHATCLDLFPAYVKNRDPRINYQPKLMHGDASITALKQLQAYSEPNVELEILYGYARLALPFSSRA
ncbi:MAG TPA: CapA family protein [Pirellulaceae bacterium]|nr:CapA family protein [Pirellulaceae bacterium]